MIILLGFSQPVGDLCYFILSKDKYINNQANMVKRIVFVCLIMVSTLASEIFLNQTAIIEEVTKLKPSWKAGRNSYFEGRSLEEIKAMMGTLPTPKHLELPEKQIDTNIGIPDQFFAHQVWPNCQTITEIRDQGSCGSCWAFGAAEAMSDRICIASGQKIQVRISTEDILTCCGFNCGNGCRGGYAAGAWNYYVNKGVVTGGAYDDKKWCQPYAFPPCDHHIVGKYEPCGQFKPTPDCVKTCVNGADFKEDKWHSKDVYKLPLDEKKIKIDIMQLGPVSAMFTVYADFLTYQSGIYHHTTGSAIGNHAIKIIGWGVEQKIPYWLVANSWNEDWGEKGFFKIRRGNNECGIQKQVMAGVSLIKNHAKNQLLVEE